MRRVVLKKSWTLSIRRPCGDGGSSTSSIPPNTPAAMKNPSAGRIRFGDGDRPEEAVGIVIQPGGEIERVRRTPRCRRYRS